MSIFTTIALLCQISIGTMGVKISEIREEQMSCHKYYIECLGNIIGKPGEDMRLSICIKERK